MKQLKQIEFIQRALTKEKEKNLRELAKLTHYIGKKVENINRMKTYQNEYTNAENLSLSQSIPSLNKNLCAFSGKIIEMIRQAELEVEGLERSKKFMQGSIEKIENKLRLMSAFEEKAKAEARQQADRQEQRMMDDLTSIKHMRDE